jgi:hypothetical protein
MLVCSLSQIIPSRNSRFDREKTRPHFGDGNLKLMIASNYTVWSVGDLLNKVNIGISSR